MDASSHLPNLANVPNLYEILGVSRDASVADIRKARNREALKHHTDRNLESSSADRMAHINLAFDILTSAEARAAYDAKIRGDSDDYEGFATAIAAISQGRVKSELILKTMNLWRLNWRTKLKSKKATYGNKFFPEFERLLAELPQGQQTVRKKLKPSSASHMDAVKEKKAYLSALFRRFHYVSTVHSTGNRRMWITNENSLCVDRHHAILEALLCQEDELQQLAIAFSMSTETVTDYFPETCLRLRITQTQRYFEPEAAGSKLRKLPSRGRELFHGIKSASNLRCKRCNESPGVFTKLFSNTSDKFTTCQRCGACLCKSSSCVQSCQTCNRSYCKAGCLRSCSRCQLAHCFNCSVECNSCKAIICLNDNKQCIASCKQCEGSFCRKCITQCKVCRGDMCSGFAVACFQCNTVVCYSCSANCLICGRDLCCPSYVILAGFNEAQAVCKEHAAKISEERQREVNLWFQEVEKSCSNRKWKAAATQMAIVAYLMNSQQIRSEALIALAKRQKTDDQRISTMLVLMPYVDEQGLKEANTLLAVNQLSLAMNEILEYAYPPSASIRNLRKIIAKIHAMASQEVINVADPKLGESFQLASDMIASLFESLCIQADSNPSSDVAITVSKITSACSGGYFGQIETIINETSAEDNAILEASIKYLDASNRRFMLSLNEKNRCLYNVIKAVAYHRRATFDGVMRPSSLLALKMIEEAFWSGWVQFDDNKLAELLFHILLHSAPNGRADTFQLLLSNVMPNLYPLFHLPEDTEREYLKPPAPLENWSYVQLRNRDLTAIRKFEYAIRKNVYTRKIWKSIDAALAYMDMLDLCQSSIDFILCFLNSALWVLRALEESVAEKGTRSEETYARAKLICYMTDAAMQTAYQLIVITPIKFYTARLCGLIIKRAGELTKFSKFSKRAQILFDTALFYAPFCPSLLAPIVCVGDANTLQIGFFRIYSSYLGVLQNRRIDAQRMLGDNYKHMLEYYKFELEFILANSDDEEQVLAKRSIAMRSLLESHGGLTLQHVKHFLNSPLFERDNAGWLVKNARLLGPLSKGGYSRIHGISFNFENGSLQLLAEEAGRGQQPLIAPEDIVTCFAQGIAEQHALFFSLEAPNNKMTMHPFQEWRFEPAGISDSLVLHTLFHTDYLLKQFSTGVEISAEPPFLIRSIREGLLRGLPDFLNSREKGILRSLRERGGFRRKLMRMWIQADEMSFDCQQFGEDGIRFVFSEPKITIRFKIMLPNMEGKSEDINDEDEFALKPGEDGEEDPLRAEKEFCADLTKYYNQIATYFPEFQRLKEICKLFSCLRVLYGQAAGLEELARTFKVSRQQIREIHNAYYDRYDQMKNEVASKMTENLRQIDNQIPYDQRSSSEAINAITSALAAASGISQYNLTSSVQNWLQYGNQQPLIEQLVASKIPPPSPPSESEIESANRTRLSQKHRLLTDAMAAITSECRLVRSKVFSGRALPVSQWVPAVCQQRPIDGEPGRCSIVYGGVVMAPKLVPKNLANYRGPAFDISARMVAKIKTWLAANPPISGGGGSDNGGSRWPPTSKNESTRSAAKRYLPPNTKYEFVRKEHIIHNGTQFEFGQGTLLQGEIFEPWYAEELKPSGYFHIADICANYPGIDLFNESTGHAVSIKTLDASTLSKTERPRQLFNTLKKHVDQVANFNGKSWGGYSIDGDQITSRELVVGLPAKMTDAQWEEVGKGCDYAKENGVDMKIVLVEED